MEMTKLEENKEIMVKKLTKMQKEEKELIDKLNLLKTNISGTIGALQYHDYIVSQNKPTDPIELTTSEEIK